ncbi:DUF294 nucleotidyltransferase-like domain-containing protein [Paenactinomyces guangxiensis]|uniref:Nucleotidyltransferase n=1 Tax=Paenactinomyces guangxiensis TaxID=1490290 RepID=A0A7W1WQZ0_9BACL|nr:DUF294 nucleotidyltransferase-like domain-containing protein [Paenactinomyces guangxiensis]MBA4494455.1 hypothetical protein [Paenactinomyces guangxiensis]MBH8591490.1 hypothetical protein [Paenactinomyces guangxiensis]
MARKSIEEIEKYQECGLFVKHIQAATTEQQLLELHLEMPEYIRRYFIRTKTPGSIACFRISYWHDLMMSRVIELAEQEVQIKIGRKLPAFSWLLFGSAGRREPTFRTDQDHGLVYIYPKKTEPNQVDEWFKRLADKVVTGLEQAGYPLCTGNVMSTNSRWRGPLEKWQTHFVDWAENPISEHHRFLMIAADLRHMYGDPSLAKRLQKYLYQVTRKYPKVLKKGAEFNSRLRMPLGFLNQWYKERYGYHSGTVNIKQSGYLQLVGSLRILSCKYAILESSSAKRVAKLLQNLGLTDPHATEIHKSLDLFLTLRLRRHVNCAALGKAPDDFLDPHQLDKGAEKQWKQAIKCVRWLQHETLKRLR